MIGFDLFLSAENQRGKGMLGISEVCCCLYHLVSQKRFVMDAVDKWTSGQVASDLSLQEIPENDQPPPPFFATLACIGLN